MDDICKRYHDGPLDRLGDRREGYRMKFSAIASGTCAARGIMSGGTAACGGGMSEAKVSGGDSRKRLAGHKKGPAERQALWDTASGSRLKCFGSRLKFRNYFVMTRAISSTLLE